MVQSVKVLVARGIRFPRRCDLHSDLEDGESESTASGQSQLKVSMEE